MMRTELLRDSFINRYEKHVKMGRSDIVKAGSRGKLNSGDLLVCSVFVGKVYKNGRYLCTIMCHRGLESQFEFARNINEVLNEFGDIRDLTVEPIALQTAPNTDTSRYPHRTPAPSPLGQHARTDEELIMNLNFIFKIKPKHLSRFQNS
ncbi:MAG: hypothetical protein ABW166_12960 [Sedimenticola sp.]